MTVYGSSPWLKEFPKSRVPSYPKHRGADAVRGRDHRRRADRLRHRLRVCRGRRQGDAARGRADRSRQQRFLSGWISEDPGVPFADLEQAVGRRGAKRAYQSWRRAALDFAALLRRLDIKCGIEAHPSITIATTPDQVARIMREQKARKAAGVDGTLLNARAIAAEVGTRRASRAACERRRDHRSVSRLRRPGGRSREPRRAALRKDDGEEGHLQPQDRRRAYRHRPHPHQPRHRRHRDADGALQVAGAAFLFPHGLLCADRRGTGEDPPADGAPRRRASRLCGAAASGPMGRGPPADRRARMAIRPRSVCGTKWSCSGPAS